MKEKISALRENFRARLKAAQTPEQLEEVRVSFLGKKGPVSDLMAELRNVEGEQKARLGQLFCRIDLTFVGPVWAQRLVLFVLMGLAMTLIELIAGEIFILGMHVQLWDYSPLWGNYKGIICPLFSLIWTVLAIAFFYLVYPIADNAVAWLGRHITFLFVVGMFYGVFLVDFCHSVRLGARIRRFAAENNLVVKYETFKLEVRARSKKHTFFRSIAGGIAETPLFEALRAYREKYPSPLTRYRTRKEKEKATSGAPQAQTSVCAQTDTPAHNNAEQNGEQKP